LLLEVEDNGGPFHQDMRKRKQNKRNAVAALLVAAASARPRALRAELIGAGSLVADLAGFFFFSLIPFFLSSFSFWSLS
jgi:hypothetical protein